MQIKATNTILYCKKWKETVEFYKTKLKLNILTNKGWFVEFRLTDSSYLSIADEAKASIDSNLGKGITLSLKVKNIEKIYLELKTRGANPSSIKDHPWGAKVFYVFDPEGNRIEFWS